MDALKNEKSRGNPRNTDKRRERSKVAARHRRGKESEIFANLAACLPLTESVRSTLDKASIARIALTYLKLREMMSTLFTCTSVNSNLDLEFEALTNNAMGGFVIVFTSEGDVIYVSESITQHLGLSQCEVMGHSIFDFSHPCDHVDIKELFVLNKTDSQFCHYRNGIFRMKCTITSKGRSVHLRAASYKAINCTGHLFTGKNIMSHTTKWYVGIGEPIPDPTNIPFPLNKQAFVTRHTTDMKCEDVAGSVENFLGYKVADLIGKSLFQFHHAADGEQIAKKFKSLYVKGQIQTDRYRFLARNGGWVWITTQATVLKSNNDPSGVVCLHFITSDIQNPDQILSSIQSCVPVVESEEQSPSSLRCVKKDVLPLCIPEPESVHAIGKENCRPPLLTGAGLSSPTPSTAKIFAPRTDDMDSGFLMPGDNNPMDREGEPDDLTHLAPIAGDDCVSLNVPLLDDLLKSFDQANLEYALNGFICDVEADELPLFEIQTPKTGVTSNLNGSIGSDFLLDTSSLLLQSSDPNLGRTVNFEANILSPSTNSTDGRASTSFIRELSFSGYENELEDSIEFNSAGVISPVVRECFDGRQTIGLQPMWSDVASKNKPPDDLSEFTAPYIPIDEGCDLPLLGAGAEFTWPPEFMVHNTTDVDAANQVQHSTNQTNHFKKLFPVGSGDRSSTNCSMVPGKSNIMTKDANIDRVRWSVDIESILGSRMPGDAPKVVTKFIFANAGPPAVKVRKIGPGPQKPTLDVAISSMSGTSMNCTRTSVELEDYHMADIAEALKQDRGLGIETGILYRATALQESRFNSYRKKRNLYGALLETAEGGIPTLCELTRQDCEVNLPLEHSSLLQGSELIVALETENCMDSL